MQRVRTKGVSADVVLHALADVDRESGDADEDPELSAAQQFAKRRRLGPFRDAASRAARRDRDLAALVRAGFSYEIVRRVIDLSLE